MRLVMALRQKGLVLTVNDVFQNPRLVDMAASAVVQNLEFREIPRYGLVHPSTLENVSKLYDIDPRAIQDLYPATPLQEGLWALTQRRPEAYCAQIILKIPPQVMQQRYLAAWAEVARRCDILRTCLAQVGDTTMQLVLHEAPTINPISDDRLEVFLTRDEQHRMSEGRHINRFSYSRPSPNTTWYFVWSTHHAIYDGVSLPTILRAVEQVYSMGHAPEIVQFNTFVAHLQEMSYEVAARYWRSKLDQAQCQTFPALLPNQVPQPSSHASYQFRLDRRTGSDITSASILQAAWALLLSLYTDSDDICYATTVNGRTSDLAIADLVAGPTLATVPVRTVIRKDQTVLHFLKYVQQSAIESRKFEHFGLQNIRQLSEGARGACNLQNLFIVQPNENVGASSNLGIDLVDKVLSNFYTYAINVECMMGADGVRAQAHFDSSIIDVAQVPRMLAQLETICQQLVSADESALVQDISAVTESDCADFRRWNEDVPDASYTVLHDLFSAAARAVPKATAIEAWDGVFSYSQAEHLSTRIACEFIANHIQQETRVIVCLEKNRWAPVLTLALLKAGCTIVPVDAAYPLNRISTIARITNSSVAIASAEHCDKLRAASLVVHSVSDLCSRASEDDLLSAASSHRLAPVDPSSEAFVFFTSGSSGTPKAVPQLHCMLSTSLTHQAATAKLPCDSKVLQFASHTFDHCLTETFGAFLANACLCIPSNAERTDGLQDFMVHHDVTVAVLTATVARLLEPANLPKLKTLFIGGEPLTRDLVNDWGHSVQLINLYGITETMCYCAMGESEASTSVPSDFGRGYSCATWIVEKGNPQRLCPIGVPGELLIEGPCVAEGYIDSATASTSFIESPGWLRRLFPMRKPNRLYLSGDLVKYSAQGTLQYVSRIDKQEVKLQGQRVNLGEIESVVTSILPRSLLCAVELVKLKSDLNKPQLVVFIGKGKEDDVDDEPLPDDDSQPLQLFADVELEAALQDRLPRHMCPNLYLRARKLPMTVSGKLDRKQMLSWAGELTIANLRKQRAGPVESLQSFSRTERVLHNFFQEILSLPPDSFGLNGNFFHLNGDSVAAMRLVARARKLGITLTVAQIFNYPVLAEMAKVAGESDHYAQTDVYPPPSAFELMGAAHSKELLLADISEQNPGLDIAQIEDVYPVSSMQAALLAAYLDNPSSYLSRFPFNVPESLDRQRLKSAWAEVKAKNAILRTRFVHSSNEILQIVLRADFDHNSDESAKGTFSLFHLDIPNEVMDKMVLCAHHAAFDGWFMSRLLDQLSDAYNAPNELTPLLPFNVFIKYAQQQQSEEAAAFWSSKLEGASRSEFPEMPVGYKATTSALITREVQFVQRTGTGITAASLLRAAWALLISNYTLNSDVIFGVTMTGRAASLPGIEDIGGPTIVTNPARVAVIPELTLAEYLKHVQRQMIDEIPYEQYGLHNIRRLGAEIAPLCKFNSVLVVQNDEHEWGSQLGLTSAQVDRRQSHPHAINLQCIVKKSSILLEANYDDQLLNRVSMNRILQQLEHSLNLLNESSLTSTIRRLDMLSPEHLKQIAEYNANMPPAVEDCLHRLIEERVHTEPHAAAVCAWDGTLTYQELDERSTRLAKHIRTAYALKSDEIILLHFEKSMWTVVSMYATLKAGCAYAFLGIQDPRERHRQLIATTRSRLVLISQSLAGAMATHDISQLVVDGDLLHSLPAMDIFFQSDVQPHNLAFVVFSSGSTGVPKTAMIEHRSAATSAIAHGSREGLNTASRVYQFASYNFDISTGDTLTTLIMGGCVCIPSEEHRLGDITGSMKALGINHACLTPTVVSLLKPDDVPGLKTLKLGGEALTRENVATWADKVHLINGYGPCEASIWCSYRTGISTRTDHSNCGSAVGCVLWIANPEDYNKLTPLGAIGELLIEGPTLARGYLGDEERTIGAFVQPDFLRDMFPERPARVYRTGDLFRYAPDGTLRFVRRKDSQVKVHGQRIELEEIEYHIASAYAGDGLGAVVYPRDGQFKGKLVAVLSFGNAFVHGGDICILPKGDEELARTHFRRLETELIGSLPRYMVPHVWIAVEALPVNPSGKLHRAVLTKWTENLSSAQQQIISDTMDASSEQNEVQWQPLSVSERTIQKIWAKVLGVSESRINADSNYFALGGDSLSAMQIASLCRSKGLNLTMKDILGCQTLAMLASSASAALESLAYDHTKETRDTSTRAYRLSAANFESLSQSLLFPDSSDSKLAIDDVFPATPMQHGIFLSRLKEAQSYDISIYLRITSSPSEEWVDLNRLTEAWRRVVHRHPSLRTVFVDDAKVHTGLLQVVIGGILTQSRQYSVADEIEALNLHRQTPPCWDSKHPEQSVAFYQLPTGDVICALDIAHTLTDAWSTDLIIRDLAAAYDGLLPTEPAPSLRELSEYLTEERRSSSISYWKRYLQDAEPCLIPDLDVQPASTSHVDVDVSFAGLDFRGFCHRTQTTPAVLFQAIYALTLRIYTGRDDVVFGLLSSGRDIPIPEVEDTLGTFITMLIGRFCFDTTATIQAVVQKLQRDYVKHLSYQFFSLADLQTSLGLAGQPLFDTVLSVLAEPSATQTPKSGLHIDPIDQDGLTEYALVVNVDQSQESVSATFTADLRHISEAQLHSIASTFSHIAFEMIAKQELQLGDINTISEVDRQRIDSWNSQCPEHLELCVNTLLQDQMHKNPGAPAIFAFDGQLSYDELSRLSAAVAAHLIQLGLRPGSFVPFCFEHSMYAIVCIVGIIRAGLAAVPLDPSHPLTRLQLISSQVDAKVLLCSREQLGRCKGLAIQVVAAVQDILDAGPLCKSAIEKVAVQPSDPVYVIFTSGSTVSML